MSAYLLGSDIGTSACKAALFARETVSIQRTHHPAPEARQGYDRGYARYLELYERLAPMMCEETQGSPKGESL